MVFLRSWLMVWLHQVNPLVGPMLPKDIAYAVKREWG